MDGESTGYADRARAPLHLWVIGVLLVLWNGVGVAIAIGAQTARLPSPDPEVTAYFDSQPAWFAIIADLGPLAGLAGSVALLLQSRHAVRLFVAQLAIIAVANAYEVVIGRSLLIDSPETRSASLVLVVMIAAEIAYAWHLTRRRVLY
jgi:hypothetical protein